MPDLDWNQQVWGETYDWSRQGEEWSEAWGGSGAQWFGSLLPRIRCFVPCHSILEIAPGCGRWTKFLLPLCQDFLGIDISEACIQACRARFGTRGQFLTNDGHSLAAAQNEMIDLVFSFDSLVHAEMEVMESYLPQIIAKLSAHGVAFVHHSNLGMLGGKADIHHERAAAVSAESVRACIVQAGGHILRQEIIPWGSTECLDCITLFARSGAYQQATVVKVNNRFFEEAAIVRSCIAPWHFDCISSSDEKQVQIAADCPQLGEEGNDPVRRSPAGRPTVLRRFLQRFQR